MRVRRISLVQCFEDSSEESSYFAPSQARGTAVSDTMTEQRSDRFVVAASGAYTPGLGSITDCRGVYILASGPFTVTLNGTALPPCQRWHGTALTVAFQFDGPVSALVITNPSTTESLSGSFILFGDPA